MSLATQLFPFGPGPAFVCKCIVNRSCESIFVLEVRVKWRWGRNRMWNTGRSHQRSTPLLTHLPEFVFQRTCAADTMGTWYNVHQFTRSVQMLIGCFRSFRSYTVSQSQRLHMRLNWPHIVVTLPSPIGIGEDNLHPENLDLYGLKRPVIFQQNCISVFLLLIQISWRIELYLHVGVHKLWMARKSAGI